MNEQQSPPPTLSEESLRELKVLYSKATPGPWEYYRLTHKGAPDPDGMGYVRPEDYCGQEIHHTGDAGFSGEMNLANGELTVAMFNAFPSLLHAAEQMARYRAALEILAHPFDIECGEVYGSFTDNGRDYFPALLNRISEIAKSTLPPAPEKGESGS